MKCYSHNQADAVGICKSCSKAVCLACGQDTGRGLSCSEICTREIDEQNQIIDKSKRIYSIGQKPSLMPTGLIMHFFFAILFTSFGIYQSTQRSGAQWFLIAMGLGFFVIGCIGWYKNRKLNLNC